MRIPALLLAAACLMTACEPAPPGNTRIKIDTSLGEIILQLEDARAPATVENFLEYIDSDGYQGTLFHRVIPGFMVQGGGYYQGYRSLAPVRGPVVNEADNGLRNVKGAIAMARTADIDSATRQFFINVADHNHLDHSADSCTRQQVKRGETDCKDFGYAVFGRVESGMDIVEQIVMTETRTFRQLRHVPVEDIVIHGMERL